MPEYLTLTGSARICIIGKTQVHLIRLGDSTIMFRGERGRHFGGVKGGIKYPNLFT